MIKLRVQCLPEHIGKTKVSLLKNFKIHSISQNYPQKNSEFVRIYIEASPLDADSMIRVESVIDILNIVNSKYSPDMKTSAIVYEIIKEIYMAVDPKYTSVGEQS